MFYRAPIDLAGIEPTNIGRRFSFSAQYANHWTETERIPLLLEKNIYLMLKEYPTLQVPS